MLFSATSRSLLAVVLLALPACTDEAAETGEPAGASAPVPAASAPAAASRAVAEGTLLDPNEASREQLMGYASLDAPVADELIAGRPYSDMLEVDRVLSGRLEEAQREQLYSRLWLPLDLNTATEEEVLLIPGVGNRMAHEFEEYRPYRAMAQFRREIGKYVDDEEVARLERYVTIR